jgi:hypothetical protein
MNKLFKKIHTVFVGLTDNLNPNNERIAFLQEDTASHTLPTMPFQEVVIPIVTSITASKRNSVIERI